MSNTMPQMSRQIGVRKESEQLEDTLTLIRGVLEDAEEKPVKNEAVKVWLKQLTSISYDADDVLDEWKTRILSSQIQQLDAPVSEKMAVGLSDRSHPSDTRADMKALNRWGYYPLILIGSWAFGTINRIHDFIDPGHKKFWLSFLDVGMAALMGLFNSIAYGLNSSVRRAIHERLDLWCPERLRRWLPASLKLRGQPQESELVSLKVQDEH